MEALGSDHDGAPGIAGPPPYPEHQEKQKSILYYLEGDKTQNKQKIV